MKGDIAYLFILLFLCISTVRCFKNGDIISFSKRSYHKGITSPWSEMLGKHSPKFGFDKTVKLPALDPDEYSSDQPYKIAFSAADGQYITPWITVSDGFGTYLQFVEFTFVYSGNDIIEMKWKTDYNTGEHAGKIPTALYLHFNWEELKEKDLSTGLTVLFISGFVFGCGMLVYVLIDTDMEERRTRHKRSQGSTPVFAFNSIPNTFATTIRKITPSLPSSPPPAPYSLSPTAPSQYPPNHPGVGSKSSSSLLPEVEFEEFVGSAPGQTPVFKDD